MDDIKKLSEQFRYAIDSALKAGEFKDDFSFHELQLLTQLFRSSGFFSSKQLAV